MRNDVPATMEEIDESVKGIRNDTTPRGVSAFADAHLGRDENDCTTGHYRWYYENGICLDQQFSWPCI